MAKSAKDFDVNIVLSKCGFISVVPFESIHSCGYVNEIFHICLSKCVALQIGGCSLAFQVLIPAKIQLFPSMLLDISILGINSALSKANVHETLNNCNAIYGLAL